jgi:CheY-like chemotaxis protein
MGLGLPLARWIAQRLGGGVQVRSEPGVGSVFCLRIPVGPLGPGPWLTPGAARNWWQTHRDNSRPSQIALRGSVLLAEDSNEVRELLIFALERTGVRVEAVSNGLAAIESVKTASYDLILLDIRMPHVDGMQAARAIRALNYTGPLIALTASTTQTERDRILAAGFDDLWPKPISLERLVQLASAYLDSTPPAYSRTADPVNDRLKAVRTDFAQSLPDRMERLHKALEAADMEAVGELLHQLLGSSGTVGFMELSDQARIVHEQFKAGALTPASADLLRLYEIASQNSRG